MKSYRHASLVIASMMLASCASMSEKGTIAQLRHVKLDLSDQKIEGGIDKAMAGYQKFLKETPESAMTPEAIRRLADLKIEKEYGTVESPDAAPKKAPEAAQKNTAGGQVDTTLPSSGNATMARPEQAAIVAAAAGKTAQESEKDQESQADFEARTTRANVPDNSQIDAQNASDDLENKNAEQAIALYQKLLKKYPMYERNDQVLYQMARAYEELGEVEQAIKVMDRIVSDFPDSRYIDEVQFRRGEFFFTRKKYLDAEDAYKAIVQIGSSSFYYELALYKLGWTYYKQEMYEDAMNQFVALLDYKVQTGYDFQHPTDEFEQKRIEDTHRVISLSFSSMGGPDAVVAYFKKHGARRYEVDIYRNLGEYYLKKRRYADAASSYKTFVRLNPYNKVSPHFDMRVIEIYKKGGFPKLVIDANKEFATNYGLKSKYWQHFDVDAYPDVLALLKTNLKELANYYHALYQNKQFVKDKPANFSEAQHWYHEFLDSFPKDPESPVMNYQLADLLLENKSFHEAALEYERTAYDYPAHKKSAAAGYAAVYAHRENLAVAPEAEKETVKRDVIRSSLRFAETFPKHDKASLVMGAALEDIYAMKDYKFAVTTGRKLLDMFPTATQKQRRAAWLVVAHSSFELENYPDAEQAYLSVLQLTPEGDKSRQELTENLAASIYKQGEQANEAGNYQAAADNFLRLGVVAPGSKMRPAADYDAATALMKLKDWKRAADVLLSFRRNYPDNKLQPDVTKKLAQVYSEDNRLAEAAVEYERIEKESKDEKIRREALKVAADLYMKVGNKDKAVEVYRRFIHYFPAPLEPVVEMHHSIAKILKDKNDTEGYHQELRAIVRADSQAGEKRTDRMRYLAGNAALELAKPLYEEYAQIKLVQPFDKSLKKKRYAMKKANAAFGKLVNYELGDVTAAATYYIAEIYYNFSRSLMNSERPTGMGELEAQQYEDLLDEKSYPFEQKAIQIHKKNVALIGVGVYDQWIDKSIARLAKLVPGRYAKNEQSSGFISDLANLNYQALTNPQPPAPAPVAASANTTAAADPGPQSKPAAQQQVQQALADDPVQSGKPAAAAAQQTAPQPTGAAESTPATENAAPATGADVQGETSGDGDASAASRGDDAVETKDAAPADTASVKTVAGDESDTRVGKQTPVLRADQQAADSSNVTEGGE